jgi:hypothetical protein
MSRVFFGILEYILDLVLAYRGPNMSFFEMRMELCKAMCGIYGYGFLGDGSLR